MAFRRTQILATIQRIDQDLRTSRFIVPSAQVLDPFRYGYQFSSKSIRDGLVIGRRWLNRIPRHKKIHPEIKDMIDANRTMLFFGIAGIVYITYQLILIKNAEDRRFNFKLASQRGFIERYAYRQNPVEFSQRFSNSYS